MPHAPILDLDEALDDPQMRHLDIEQTLTHPTEGAVRTLRSPIVFDGDRAGIAMTPPPRSTSTARTIRAALKQKKAEEMRLQGKIALVTGAGSGYGAAMARRFAAEGARVVCVDINRDAAASVAATLPGGAGIAVQCDVARRRVRSARWSTEVVRRTAASTSS